MAKQVINIGTIANDGTGDTLRNAMDKVNDNFDDIYGYANNPTTTALSLATLDSTYSTAIVGFKVYALSESPDPKVYTKTSSGWISNAVIIVT